MSIHSGNGCKDFDEGEVFISEDDIIHEYDIDEEVLLDQDDDMEPDDNPEEEEEEEEEEGVQDGAIGSIYKFQRHTDEVYTVACSPVDPLLVATGGKDERAYLWKIGNPDAVLELQGHTETVTSVAFSHDGQLLASGGFDGLVKVWDVASGTLKFTLEGSGEGFEWIKWHPKGHLIIAGSEDSSVYMWNADKGAFLSSFSAHSGVVTCGGFDPDGKVLCSGSDDKTMRIWNPKTGESIHCILVHSSIRPRTGKYPNLELMKSRCSIRSHAGHNYHQYSLSCMAITADSTVAITGAQDGSLHMVNLSTGQVRSSLVGHTLSIECIGISPSFGFVTTGGMDQKLIIWEPQRTSSRCICEHEEGITCVAWLGTTQYVASGCIDGKVRIWDNLTGNCERTFKGRSTVQSLALTADGTSIVSVSDDGIARVFGL